MHRQTVEVFSRPSFRNLAQGGQKLKVGDSGGGGGGNIIYILCILTIFPRGRD